MYVLTSVTHIQHLVRLYKLRFYYKALFMKLFWIMILFFWGEVLKFCISTQQKKELFSPLPLLPATAFPLTLLHSCFCLFALTILSIFLSSWRIKKVFWRKPDLNWSQQKSTSSGIIQLLKHQFEAVCLRLILTPWSRPTDHKTKHPFSSQCYAFLLLFF